MFDPEDSLGLAPGELRLVPYMAEWAQCFARERARIAECLSDVKQSVTHIGSTSVPGLAAKPILDIGLTAAAQDLAEIAARLPVLGYVDKGPRPDGGGRILVRTRGKLRTHNLHLYHPDDPEWHDQRDFAEALRADSSLRALYAARKAALVADPAIGRLDYPSAKGGTVQHILETWRARQGQSLVDRGGAEV